MTLGTFVATCYTLVVVIWVISLGLTISIRTRTSEGKHVEGIVILNSVLVITWYLTVIAGVISTIWYIFD